MPYQWKYFVSKQIFINRISEFNNFYPQTEKEQTVLCAEITNLDDYSQQAFFEILHTQLKLDKTMIDDMRIIDIQHAYPIYQKGYQQIIDAAKTQLSDYNNLYILGRQAQFPHLDIDKIYKDAKTLITTEFL